MSMHSIRLALVATVLGLSTAAQERRRRKARAAKALAGPAAVAGVDHQAAGTMEALARHRAPVLRQPVGTMAVEPA